MILDSKHEIKLVIVEDDNGMPGDIYDDMREFRKEHPNGGYRFGFCVVCTETKCIPKGCLEWNDSPEAALYDYYDNVLG